MPGAHVERRTMKLIASATDPMPNMMMPTAQ
jgi:hypothetical protein